MNQIIYRGSLNLIHGHEVWTFQDNSYRLIATLIWAAVHKLFSEMQPDLLNDGLR